MSMFGAKFLWHFRLAQFMCAAGGLVIAYAGSTSFSQNTATALALIISGFIIFAASVLIEKALRDLDRVVIQQRADAMDIADLARSAVQSVRQSDAKCEGMTLRVRTTVSSIQQSLDSQNNRVRSFDKMGLALETLQIKLQDAASLQTKNQDELLKKLARLRQIYSDLRGLAAEASESPAQSSEVIDCLEACKTSVVNLGLELAAVVGDHPEFFAAANRTLGQIISTVDSVRLSVAAIAAPRIELGKKIREFETSLAESTKYANALAPLSAMLGESVEIADSYPKLAVIKKLAGIQEIESTLTAAKVVESAFADFADAQSRGLNAATRALSVIDRASNANKPATSPVTPITASPEIPAISAAAHPEKTLLDFGADLSPAGEIALRQDAKDQIDIATRGRTVA